MLLAVGFNPDQGQRASLIRILAPVAQCLHSEHLHELLWIRLQETMFRTDCASCLLVFLLTVYSVCSLHRSRDKSATSRHRERVGDNNRPVEDSDGECEMEIVCQLDGANSSTSLQPLKLPFRGPRGPRGLPGPRGERGHDGKPGPPGKPVSSRRGVAFFVGLTSNVGPVAEHSDIVFDRVVTNKAGAYNVETGRFTAPVNGAYQFNVVIAAQGRQKAAVMVLKNGAMVATVWAESLPYWSTASNVVILSLARGEQVWLMLLNKASFLHGYMYSTFSGFLIFAT